MCSKVNSLHLQHLNEPQHNKTNKITCAASQDSEKPGHLPSLIGLSTVLSFLMNAHWVHIFLLVLSCSRSNVLLVLQREALVMASGPVDFSRNGMNKICQLLHIHVHWNSFSVFCNTIWYRYSTMCLGGCWWGGDCCFVHLVFISFGHIQSIFSQKQFRKSFWNLWDLALKTSNISLTSK